ncbi:MAG TPA: choice-of-anchor V domain-containing protein [Bacteroidia bacterium]
MRKIYLRNLIVGASFILVLTSAIMSASGPGGGYSNAPGESNCTSCHGGSMITSGNANLNKLLLYGNFTGNGYIPDSTYEVTVSYKQSGKSKFGFQVTVLNGADAPIGTLTNVGSRTSKVTANINSATRQYIQHTSTGTAQVTTDSTNWTFEWKAPSTNVGPVYFHVVVMATNNNSSNDAGDQVYGKTFKMDPSSLLPKAQPSVGSTQTCTNYPVAFTGSGTNTPTSYAWKFVGGSPSTSTSQNPTVSFTSSGTKFAILTVKNSKGTSAPDTIPMTVTASPSALITNGTVGSVCQGDSLLISGTNISGLSYLWLHSNQTTRSVYVKDTGTYRVKITSNSTSCSATSAPFRLNWYPKPTVSIASSSSSDSFCNNYNITMTASGNNIDSVHWYVNGVLTYRTKSLTQAFTGTSNINVYALAKSTNACFSVASNTQKIVVVKSINPNNLSFTKTTGQINVKWTKPSKITKVEFKIDNGSFAQSTGDTALEVTGLNPNTTYQVTLRSHAAGPCSISDTVFSIKTNACSNLQYGVIFNDRTCKGNELTATITSLFNAKYSISFNGGLFLKDTIYKFSPTVSDSLRIRIVDSLSTTCPPIEETIAYTIDQPVDTSTNTSGNVSICGTSNTLQAKAGYTEYEFFLNNVSKAKSASSSFAYTGLKTGDVLTYIGTKNSCSKTYGPITVTVNTAADAGFTFTRNWKNYNFLADQASNASYVWKVGSTVIGSTESFTSDFSAYNNSSVQVSLKTQTTGGCIDSSVQTLNVPNFTSINVFEDLGITFLPNPFNNNISVLSEKSNIVNIKVIDQMGRTIYTMNNLSEMEIIDTQDWSKGIYHIVVQLSDDQFAGTTMVKL